MTSFAACTKADHTETEQQLKRVTDTGLRVAALSFNTDARLKCVDNDGKADQIDLNQIARSVEASGYRIKITHPLSKDCTGGRFEVEDTHSGTKREFNLPMTDEDKK